MDWREEGRCGLEEGREVLGGDGRRCNWRLWLRRKRRNRMKRREGSSNNRGGGQEEVMKEEECGER